MYVDLRWTGRQRYLANFLEILAALKERSPGTITKPFLRALADIPLLTIEFAAQERIARLLRRIGFPQQMIARDQRKSPSRNQFKAGFSGQEDQDTPEKRALNRLFREVVSNPGLTPEAAARLLKDPEKNIRRDEQTRQRSDLGKRGAAARHAASNAKKQQLREIWATGIYGTREICADEESGAFGMSSDWARKALRNSPDPNPWPAKEQKR